MRGKRIYAIMSIMKIKPLVRLVIITFAISSFLYMPSLKKQSRDAFGQDSRDDKKITSHIIGSLFRITAKIYIKTSDIEALKKRTIDKINCLDEEAFHERYIDLYEHIYDSQFLIANYGLYENMTKIEAVKKIASLDKQKLYTIVDNMPDYIIAREFRRCTNNSAIYSGPNPIERIAASLNKMIESVKRKYF